MKRIIYFLCCLFFVLTACQNENNSSSSHSNEVVLTFEGLPVDSCAVRIHHIITGEEVFATNNIKISEDIIIPSLVDDFYIIVLSWPKTIISHQVYKSKSFDKDTGEDIFEFTKPLYINHVNKAKYTFRLAESMNIEDIEQNGNSSLKFHNVNCKDCDLADQYWNLYNDFFERKDIVIDSLKTVYYAAVEANNSSLIKEKYEELENYKKNHSKDDKLDQDMIELLNSNLKSPVSTFFLFYQLYNHREFPKFKSSFDNLSDAAKQTKYYRMINNQY